MLLSQGLTQLKNLKSKAARTETYINSSAVYYEDTVPEYDYEQELVNRANLNDEILNLKTRIQITNATTIVNFGVKRITLAELILRNAALRTEMAFVAAQMRHTADETDRWSGGRKKDELKKVLAKGCEKQSLKHMLDQLEKDKENLEAVLANANATTTLVDV